MCVYSLLRGLKGELFIFPLLRGKTFHCFFENVSSLKWHLVARASSSNIDIISSRESQVPKDQNFSSIRGVEQRCVWIIFGTRFKKQQRVTTVIPTIYNDTFYFYPSMANTLLVQVISFVNHRSAMIQFIIVSNLHRVRQWDLSLTFIAHYVLWMFYTFLPIVHTYVSCTFTSVNSPS